MRANYSKLSWNGVEIIVSDKVPENEIWGLQWVDGNLIVTKMRWTHRQTLWSRCLRFARSLVGRGGRSR